MQQETKTPTVMVSGIYIKMYYVAATHNKVPTRHQRGYHILCFLIFFSFLFFKGHFLAHRTQTNMNDNMQMSEW